MPCDSSYMEASGYEVALSQVCCLLDELMGIPIDKNHWRGYHPKIYNKYNVDGDSLVRELCYKLQNTNVNKYSLEMQLWWREHQKADKERIERELKKAEENKQKESALNKLTPYERKLLGI